ncbi:hypothetical protein F4604DRAFT_1930535 [Suillus subluteus]|nr:hypothetical protein F4604DRAFT_1930535 [Suillus subluteus]
MSVAPPPPVLHFTGHMSVFEPKVVLNLLKNSVAISPIDKNAFEKSWTVNESTKMKKATDKNIPGDVEDARAHMNQPANLEGYCFATTSAAYWSSWEHWRIPRNIPIFFYCCALTRDLFDLLVEMRPSTTSAGLEERVRQLHLLEHKRRMLEYLEVFQIQPTCNANSRLTDYFSGSKSAVTTLQAFSSASDPLAYADKSISGEVITEVFLDFCTQHKAKGEWRIPEDFIRLVYRKTRVTNAPLILNLAAICGSLDNTFKAASKATLTNKDRQKSRELKGGILSVLNEDNQIISWRFCQMRTNAEITELLQGLKHRHDILNVPQPKMMTDSKLDVWHFSARYIAVMLQSSKSPYRGAVAADITGTILKTHAEKGQPAQYWDRAEQERRLMVAFSKWADKGVWSAAAQKVHQEQLKHVRKGCLERSSPRHQS